MEHKTKFSKIYNILFLIILFGVSLFKTIAGYSQNCKQVIGYYPNWQWYDRNKLVNPESIDYSKYTILNYCFFDPQPDGTINATDPWADENLLLGSINWSTGGYYPNTSIVDLAHNNGVKIIPSIGGWTLSSNFPAIAADPNKRSVFAQSCVQLIQDYNFDGIDIDWEYPGFSAHNGTSQDKINFNLLLQEVRMAIDNYGASIGKQMILTACVSADPIKMNDVDWASIDQYLDYINLMSYDFFGAFDPITNHNSPLYAPNQGNPSFNLHSAIQTLVNNHNVNPNKLNAGLAFYGRTQTTHSTPGLHVSGTGNADMATFGTDQGTPLYYNVLESMNLFNYHWDSTAQVPYLTGKNGLNTFVSYDDEKSIGKKAEYIVDNNLAGAIIWEITGDYVETFSGSGIISGTPLADTLNWVFCNYENDTLIDGGNIGDDSISLSLNTTTQSNFKIYPNPFNQTITIDFDEVKNALISIESMEGKFMMSRMVNSNQISLSNLDFLEQGIYLLKVEYIDEKRFDVFKILKN